jgi:ABC-2 type transport system ATP-binding protein
MSTCISIENLSKQFGKVWALSGVSLSIEPGVYGLLGRNGAGKTTLMRILAGLLQKTDGDISVFGTDISSSREIRKITGYMPQEFSFYPRMRVDETLDYIGRLSYMKGDYLNERIENVLLSVNLQGERRKRIKELSGGMIRRLGIAQAILHEPKVLIADEPTAGLDPVERIRFRELIKSMSGDRAIILSTHIVSDIEACCTSLAVLETGKVLYSGSVKDFTGKDNSIEDAYMTTLREAGVCFS